MRSLLYLISAAALLFPVNWAAQAACWQDVLERRQGSLLFMRSGAVYRVLGDAAATTFWLPLARVSVCDQVVVNVMGEAVPIYELRNQDGNDLVRAALEGR